MVERIAAWAWDNLLGGVPTQLWIWSVAPKLAAYCEDAANRRDGIERAK